MPLTEYEPGTTFPGVIGRTTDVTADRSGELITDTESEIRMAMARQ